MEAEVERELLVDWERLRVYGGGTEGTSGWAPLDEATRAELLALFQPELRGVYAADEDVNMLPLGERPAAPACDDGGESPVVCQALDMARERLVVTFAEPDADIVHREQFFFEGPTILSPETADMILRLEELRAEVAAGP